MENTIKIDDLGVLLFQEPPLFLQIHHFWSFHETRLMPQASGMDAFPVARFRAQGTSETKRPRVGTSTSNGHLSVITGYFYGIIYSINGLIQYL